MRSQHHPTCSYVVKRRRRGSFDLTEQSITGAPRENEWARLQLAHTVFQRQAVAGDRFKDSVIPCSMRHTKTARKKIAWVHRAGSDAETKWTSRTGRLCDVEAVSRKEGRRPFTFDIPALDLSGSQSAPWRAPRPSCFNYNGNDVW